MATYGLGDLPRWEYRDILKLLYGAGWHDVENLLRMGCVVLAESGGFPHAWHWNSPAEGGNGSTDWGMFQLNDGESGRQPPEVDMHGKPMAVTQFQIDALDPARASVRARQLYSDRGFQPWFGYAKWLNYAPAMTRAMANMLREEYGIPLL